MTPEERARLALERIDDIRLTRHVESMFRLAFEGGDPMVLVDGIEESDAEWAAQRPDVEAQLCAFFSEA